VAINLRFKIFSVANSTHKNDSTSTTYSSQYLMVKVLKK